PAGWKAGTVLAGSQLLRFQNLDLYAMGMMPKEEVPSTLRSFITLPILSVYKDGRAVLPTSFDAKTGPQMGLRAGVALRPGAKDETSIKFADIIAANKTMENPSGDRNPAYGTAPHYIKQLWIVVSKPQAYIEQDAKD